MAIMKRKQFVLLSHLINRASHNPANDINTLNHFVDLLVIEFAKDNQLFNESLFRQSCGNCIEQRPILNNLKTGTGE